MLEIVYYLVLLVYFVQLASNPSLGQLRRYCCCNYYDQASKHSSSSIPPRQSLSKSREQSAPLPKTNTVSNLSILPPFPSVSVCVSHLSLSSILPLSLSLSLPLDLASPPNPSHLTSTYPLTHPFPISVPRNLWAAPSFFLPSFFCVLSSLI